MYLYKLQKHVIHLWMLIFTIHFHPYSQLNDINFRHISIEQGLSQSAGNCILQDSDGFIWIGTETGLNKYDGYTFTIYNPEENNPNSLSNGYILSLCEDHTGTLWIGTEHGLNSFDKNLESFTRYTADSKNPATVSGNRIFSVYEDKAGILWIGTDNGLTKFDRGKKQYSWYIADPGNPRSLSNNSVRAICQDTSGTLWIGTDEGLNKFDRINNLFIQYHADTNNRFSLSHNSIRTLLGDRHGTLWIGTDGGGVNFLEPNSSRFSHYENIPGNSQSLSDNKITALYEGGSGILWIGTEAGGLNIFNRKNKLFTRYVNKPDDPNSLSNDKVRALCEDSDGGIWVGTYIGGVNVYNRTSQKFKCVKTNLSNPTALASGDLRPIFEDRSGRLWIGSDGGGLYSFDRATGIFRRYTADPKNRFSLSDNRVFSICEDQAGSLWIGTQGGGLNRFDRTTKRFFHYKHNPKNPAGLCDDRIRTMLFDQLGILWIGTNGGGLTAFNPKTGRFVCYTADTANPYAISNNRIYRIYEDRSGTLWAGTFGGGLNRFDRATGRFFHFVTDTLDNQSISNDFVLSIHLDASGILWVGTLNGGLNRLDPLTNKFARFTTKDGLPNNTIYNIVDDTHGNLWMSTNRGISKFTPAQRQFKNYDISYGLQSNEFSTGSSCITRDGEIFFGGINGFNSFYPDSIRDNSNVPKVVLTSFQLFNKPVLIGRMKDGRTLLTASITRTKGLQLSHSDAVFSFEFVALHYASPEKNQYAYMMQGLEKEWNYAGKRRFVTYTSLAPGRYVFKVKASNNDGVWNERGTSIKITLVPPFWKTWWFYCCCIIAGIMLIYAFYELRLRSIRMKNRLLEERVQKRTYELNSAKDLAQHRATLAILINKISHRISKELELKALMTEAVNALRDSFHYYSISIFLVDEKTYTLTPHVIASSQEKPFPENYSCSIGEGMIGLAAATGETQRSEDIGKDPHTMDEIPQTIKSEIAVPVKSREKVIGVLFIQSDKFDTFQEIEIATMETLCTHIGTAIENAFLYEQAKREIKERKRAEKALGKSEDTYRTLFNQIVDSVFIFDRTTHRFLDCNDAVERIYGYSRDEFKLMSPYELHSPEDFEIVQQNIDKENIDKPNEYTHITKYNQRITVEVLSREIDYQGKPAWLSIVRDITSRRRTEEALRESEEKHRYLVENINDVIFSVASSGIVNYISPAIEQLLKYPPASIINKPFKDIVHKDDWIKIDNDFHETSSGKSAQCECRMIKKNGDTCWMHISQRPTFDKEHTIIGSQGVMTDITERKRTEHELALTTQELHERNQEMEEDLNMAREIQTSFLSKYPPFFPPDATKDQCAAQFLHVYLPALKLAGDFFDVFPVSDHEAGVLICDVIGHGARASLLAFYLRGLLVELMPVAQDPSVFMKKLNSGLNAIITHFTTSIFATAFYLVADIKTGDLRYTNAGHPLPFILRRSKGVVERLPSEEKSVGPAIGLHKDFTYSQNTCRAGIDDIVFFFTDGVYEVWNAQDQMFGVERLHRSLHNNLTTPFYELPGKIMDEILGFASTKILNDDICLVAMHIRKLLK